MTDKKFDPLAELAKNIDNFFNHGPKIKKASDLVKHLFPSDGVKRWSVDQNGFWLHEDEDEDEDEDDSKIKTAYLGKHLDLSSLIERGLILDVYDTTHGGVVTSAGGGYGTEAHRPSKKGLSEAQWNKPERQC